MGQRRSGRSVSKSLIRPTYNEKQRNQSQNIYENNEQRPRGQLVASDIIATLEGALDVELHGGRRMQTVVFASRRQKLGNQTKESK